MIVLNTLEIVVLTNGMVNTSFMLFQVTMLMDAENRMDRSIPRHIGMPQSSLTWPLLTPGVAPNAVRQVHAEPPSI
jgi:hypothetical protein